MAAKGFIVSVYDLDLAPLGERVLSLPIRVGRSSLNDVCVSHRLVSEFHARIEEVDGRLCVRDLSSKNGVLVETVGADGATRLAAQTPVDLEPYGYEFLLSPLLRVRVRPVTGQEALSVRHSHALGSVLGNVTAGHGVGGHLSGGRAGGLDAAGFAVRPGSALAEDQLTEGFAAHDAAARADRRAGAVARPSAFGQTAQQGSPGALAPVSVSPAVQPYSSAFVEPPAGSLELQPLPDPAQGLAYPGTLGDARASAQPALAPQRSSAPAHAPQPARAAYTASPETRPSPAQPAARQSTLFEPGSAQPEPPRLAHTAWEVGPGTLPAALLQAVRPSELPGRSIEALALRGLRELAASLVPGQSVESAADVVQLVTKLHDAMEMFCRCFIPVREACSRFIPSDELERAAIERSSSGSASYVAIERALEPRAVAAALLDWRNDDQDAPRAVEHILADLMLHHLGLAQAALDGTRALLEELSPLRIESQRPAASPLARLGLPGAREKELWEAFERRHAELESAGRTFRALFGDLFTRAYLAQSPAPGSGPSL